MSMAMSIRSSSMSQISSRATLIRLLLGIFLFGLIVRIGATVRPGFSFVYKSRASPVKI
jgi:hypothetical protein